MIIIHCVASVQAPGGDGRGEVQPGGVVSVHEFVTQRLSGAGSGRRRAVLMCCCRLLFCLAIYYSPRYATCLYSLFSPVPRVWSLAVSPSQLQRVSVCLPQSESQPAHTSARLAPTPWLLLLLRLTAQHHRTTTRLPTTTTTPSFPANRVQSPLIHAKPH